MSETVPDPDSLEARLELGATGEFPAGKLDEDDEGELRMAIVSDPANGVVRILFGKPVGFLAMPPSNAREFARLISKQADHVDAAMSGPATN